MKLRQISIWQHLGWEEARPIIEAQGFVDHMDDGSENKTLECSLNPIKLQGSVISLHRRKEEREKRDGVVSVRGLRREPEKAKIAQPLQDLCRKQGLFYFSQTLT